MIFDGSLVVRSNGFKSHIYGIVILCNHGSCTAYVYWSDCNPWVGTYHFRELKSI